MDHCWTTFSHLLLDGVQMWQPMFPACAEAIRRRLCMNGLPIPAATDATYFSIFGFIDCTIRAICRPGGGPAGRGGAGARRHDPLIQRSFYQGWKKLHGLKWQAVVLPNGMIADCWGPVSARHNDLYTMRVSDIHDRVVVCQAGRPRVYRMYGDGIYPVLPGLTRRHRHNDLTPEEAAENAQMSKVRESVEWTFAKLITLWKYLAWRYALQLLSQPIGKIFGTAVLLTNAHTCFYGSEVSDYFSMDTPEPRAYFGMHERVA